MPVEINNVAIYNQFRPEPVNWLLANAGDLLRMELTLSVRTFVVASTREKIRINAYDGFVGVGWVYDKSGRFTDFVVGDTVMYYNKGVGPSSIAYFTIVEKKDNTSIRFDRAFSLTSNDFDADSIIFSVATPITALKYKYNFVENKEQPTFKSKIDGTEQQLVVKVIDASNTTPVAMQFLGEKSYQTGSATAQGVSIDLSDGVYTSNFKIIHYTKLTEFLAEQWDDLLAGKAPVYYFNEKCLKYIVDIKAATDYNNPNWIQQKQVYSTLGETGWFNENFNSGLSNYKAIGISIQDALGNSLSSIPLTTAETSVSIVVLSTGAAFVSGSTKFELQFLKAPYDKSEYQLNGRTYDDNFIDDRALQTIGSAAINGQNFGNGLRQAIKGVTASLLDPHRMKIDFKVAMLDGTVATMAESEEPRYLMTVAVQNQALETKIADLVRMPVFPQAFFIDLSDPTMVGIDSVYYRHYESGLTGEGATDIVVAPEDEVTTYSRFFIDKTGRTADAIAIQSTVLKVKAKNSVTGEEFALDNFVLPFSGLPLISGNQYVDFQLDRVFQIPPAEIRKKIRIRRRSDLDSSGKAYYDILFPFLIRWEYWVKLAGVSSDFYDITQPNLGLSQNWYRFSTLANWGCYFELTVIATKNGAPQTYKYENKFTMFDYASNPAWGPKTIKSFDPDTLAELFDVATNRKYLQGYKDTLIQADFTSTSGTPNLAKMVVNMHIDVYEEGGIEGTTRMSSKWPSDGNTWFKSIDLSNKTKLSLIGNTVRATVLVDKNKVLASNKAKFEIQSRLYDNAPVFICTCPVGYTADQVNLVCFRMVPGPGKQANIWYFGNHAGLDFNNLNANGDPTQLTDGPIMTDEGCSVWSDAAGNYLFATDGQKIYNQSRMDIGVTLKGSTSSTSAGLIVKDPAHATQFYIFTTCDWAPLAGDLFYFSKYDTATQNIVGFQLNIPLSSNKVSEGMCILNGSTPSEKYILVHEGFSANYLVYKLDATGLALHQTFTAGADFSSSPYNNVGYIRTNNKGLVAHAIYGQGQGVLMDFDAATGLLSNHRVLVNGTFNGLYSSAGMYACDFSPNGDVLYFSNRDHFNNGYSATLFQYDLTAGDTAAIFASAFLVHGHTANPGAIAKGPNDRIYAVNDDLGSLSVIKNPNVLGAGCNFSYQTVPLSPKLAIYGLPTFDLSLIQQREEIPCG